MNARECLCWMLVAVCFFAGPVCPLLAQSDADVKKIDEKIAAGEKFLQETNKGPAADKVRQEISAIAFQRLTDLRRGGDWISLKPDPDICRYAKVVLLSFEDDIASKNEGNLWVDANLIGQAIMGHSPDETLEADRALWQKKWKAVEQMQGDPPPWEYIELGYHIRKKDVQAMRDSLTLLAKRYPRHHANVWWGTKDYEGQPAWKVRLTRWLKMVDDPEWKTWEPPFPVRETSFGWDVNEYRYFMRRFNPDMPEVWDHETAKPLKADKIVLESERLKTIHDRYGGVRPLVTAGGFMWMCHPFPGEEIAKPNQLMLAPMEKLLAEGSEFTVALESVPWPEYEVKEGEKDEGPIVRCWLATEEQGTPTVWIGTKQYGLARFDLVDGKWNSQWCQTGEERGLDIMLVRTCLHNGKPKLLVLSRTPGFIATKGSVVTLWAFDPEDGKISLLFSAPKDRLHTGWFSSETVPRFMQLVAVWKDGSKVPVSQFSRAAFPELDVAEITTLEHMPQVFALSEEKENAQVWGVSADGVTPFDAQMKPGLKPDYGPLRGDSFYFSSGTRGQVGVPGSNYGYDFEARRRLFYIPYDSTWRLLRTPTLNPLCFTSDPKLLWGSCGERFKWGRVLLTAYKPAVEGPVEENDRWYGPWRAEFSIRSMDLIDGYMWLVSSGGNFHRFRPEETLRAAEEAKDFHTTAQWREQYYERVGSTWRDAVRMYLITKEYDKALSEIAHARREQPAEPAANADELDFWEALATAEKGELDAAEKLYAELAADSSAQPFVRGMALFSLANVRYSKKKWDALDQTLDQIVRLFPSLNASDWGCPEAIQWYRTQAAKGRAAK